MSVGVVRMIRIVVGALARAAAGHHGRGRVAVHAHVAHGGGVGRGVARGSGPIRLINHRLDYSSSCIDEPIVDLKDGEPGVLGQLLLLILGGVWVGQVLKQPGAQDVGGHFGENAAFFAIFALAGGVVVVAGAVGRAHAGVGGVPGLREVVAARGEGEAGRAGPRVLARRPRLVQVARRVVARQRGGRRPVLTLKTEKKSSVFFKINVY